jgi:hypothetical protein
MSSWFFVRIKDKIAFVFKPKYKRLSPQQLRDDRAYNAYRTKTRNEIDKLLDKVSKYGTKSLTKKEQKFLEENKGI